MFASARVTGRVAATTPIPPRMTRTAATAAAVNSVTGRRHMPAACVGWSKVAAPNTADRVAAVGSVCKLDVDCATTGLVPAARAPAGRTATAG